MIENRIKEIAAQIMELSGSPIPALFDGRRWKGKLIHAAVTDTSFKNALLRFIDVLPFLESDEAVIRIMGEYFPDSEALPPELRSMWESLPLNRTRPRLAAELVKKMLESLAAQFVSASSPGEAVEVLHSLRRDNFGVSVDLLGEEVLSTSEAEEFSSRYVDCIGTIAAAAREWESKPQLDADSFGPIPGFDVSLKTTSFYPYFDPIDPEGSILEVKRALKPVFDAASASQASLTLDMEHRYLKNLTIRTFKSLVEEHESFPHPGIVMQCYLEKAEADLFDLIYWAERNRRRISIRLVKGAYWDYETTVNTQRGWPVPVVENKLDTDRAYEKMTRLILRNAQYVRPAIATHNLRSIGHAIAVAESLQLGRNDFEFQMIYGMAQPLARALVTLGYNVRLYTPVGRLVPGMSYLIRRLLEITFRNSFLKRIYFDRVSLHQLLNRPAPAQEGPNPPCSGFKNEPPIDFSYRENRDNLRSALENIGSSLGGTCPLIIGGMEIFTKNKVSSLNPADPTEIVGAVCQADEEHAEAALRDANNSAESWRMLSARQRSEILLKAAEEIRQSKFDLIALEVYEVGKTWKDADGDVAEAIDYLEYYPRQMMRLDLSKQIENRPGEINEYIYEPIGIGLVVSPWNFPLAIPAGMISAALTAGNCVIFKPSGLSSVLGWKLCQAFERAGLPPGVLQFLPGPGNKIGQYLASHPGIDFISFTGSKEVGLKLLEIASKIAPGSKSPKRVVAEMGGKNAVVIDETADPDEAVKGVLESAFGFQGQKCSACSRVVVVGNIFDEFCSRLTDAVLSLRMGPTTDPGNLVGPVIDEAALNKIRHYIDRGKKKGRPLVIKKAPDGGYFSDLAVFTEIDPDSPLAQDEIFGPVLVVMRAESLDAALNIANGTQYALTGGIYSRSPANIAKTKKLFRVGNLYVNRKITGALVGRQPFGGFGMSGIGFKAGGPDYLLQFLKTRSISENTLRKGFAPNNDCRNSRLVD